LGPDGETVYFTTYGQTGVVKFDTVTDTFGQFYPVSSVNITRVGVTPDESKMYVVQQYDPVLIVDASSGNVLNQISVPTQNFDGDMSPDGAKFYVPHRDTSHVSVISTSTETVSNTITTAFGAHDMVISSDGARGYVVNEWTNTFSCLNLTSDTLISTIGVQSHPIELTISSDDSKVFVGNRDSRSVSVIDAGSCMVTSTITNAALGNRIRVLAHSSNDRLFVAGTQESPEIPPIAVYDTTTTPITFIGSIDPPAEIQSFLFVREPDTQPPVIECSANITASNAAGTCGAMIPYDSPEVSDNYPGATASCAPPSGTVFPVGMTTVTCTATDGSGNSSVCSFTVTINDTESPKITCAGDIVATTDAGQCSTTASYSVTTTDNCSGATITCTPPSGSTFPKGISTVSCIATDTAGNKADCSFSVTVNDAEAPVITDATVDKQEIWPPNHKMVTIAVNYDVSDNCDPAPSVVSLLSVTSNEPVDGTGDGDTSPDWEIVDSHHVRLRAERSGGGSGRIYTITITCTDSSGNASTQSLTVLVPHNRS
jgi:YVTN family beta-propeller protein